MYTTRMADTSKQKPTHPFPLSEEKRVRGIWAEHCCQGHMGGALLGNSSLTKRFLVLSGWCSSSVQPQFPMMPGEKGSTDERPKG